MSINVDRSSDAKEYGKSFLGDLGTLIKRYPYKGMQEFLRVWEEEMCRQRAGLEVSEWVLFTDVNEQRFRRDFLDSPDKIIQGCWNSYDKTQYLLLTKMPKLPTHELAGRTFEKLLLKALAPMGLDMKLRCYGSATRHGEDGSKQPDYQYRPMRLPRGRTRDWPTVVLEVGFSEPASKLMSDVRYWFHQSNGEVRVALTLKINRSIPEITLEKWEQDDEYGNGRPDLKQSILIHKGANNRLIFRGDPLVIDF